MIILIIDSGCIELLGLPMTSYCHTVVMIHSVPFSTRDVFSLSKYRSKFFLWIYEC